MLDVAIDLWGLFEKSLKAPKGRNTYVALTGLAMN
jgi:hypothetical protein